MKELVINIILAVWQFFQHTVASFVLNEHEPVHYIEKNHTVYCFSNDVKGLLPIGSYIFINASHWRTDADKALERPTLRKGAKLAIASRILGPLYIPVMIFYVIKNKAEK